MLRNGQRKTTIISILITLGILLLVVFLAINILALRKEPNFIYVFYEAPEGVQSPIVVSETNPVLNEPLTPLEAAPPGETTEAATEETEQHSESVALTPIAEEGNNKLNIPVVPLVVAGVILVAGAGAYLWKKYKSVDDDDDDDDDELEDDGDYNNYNSRNNRDELEDESTASDDEESGNRRKYDVVEIKGRGYTVKASANNKFSNIHPDGDEYDDLDDPVDEYEQQDYDDDNMPAYDYNYPARKSNAGNKSPGRYPDDDEDNSREELRSKEDDLDSDEIALIREIDRLCDKSNQLAEYVLEMADNMGLEPPLELVAIEDSDEYPPDVEELQQEINKLKIKLLQQMDYIEKYEKPATKFDNAAPDGPAPKNIGGNPFLVCVAKILNELMESKQALQAPQNENVVYVPSAIFFNTIMELLPDYKRKKVVDELMQHKILDCSGGNYSTVHDKKRVAKINKNKFVALITELSEHAS